MTPEERQLREVLYDYSVYENFDSFLIEKRIYKAEITEITPEVCQLPEPKKYLFSQRIDKQVLKGLYDHKALKGLRDHFERTIYLSIGE